MKEWRFDRGYRPKKTGETVDRCQNNGSVKAVSSRHCPAACVLHNCCFNCCAWTESQRQCPLHCCWWTTWTTWSKRSPTSTAQLHLPTHDLFWANLKVQLHLPPLRSLDLAWNLAGQWSPTTLLYPQSLLQSSLPVSICCRIFVSVCPSVSSTFTLSLSLPLHEIQILQTLKSQMNIWSKHNYVLKIHWILI